MKSIVSSVEAPEKECTLVCLLLLHVDSLGPSIGSVLSHLLL